MSRFVESNGYICFNMDDGVEARVNSVSLSVDRDIGIRKLN